MALTQISTGGIKDEAVTDAKLPANSVGNSEMKDDAVGVAELSATGTASSSTFLRGDNTWTAPPNDNTQLSTEQVQDIVGAMFTGNTETNITATYEDSDGTIDLVASATGTTINNNADNRVITGSGTADTLEGEANLTFNGSTLDVTGLTDTDTLNVSSTSTFIGDMNIDGSLMHNGDTNTLIKFPAADTIGFETGGTERVRIDSGGRIITGNSSQVLDTTAGTIHIDGGTSGGRLALRGTTTSANGGLGELFAYWDTTKVAGLIATSGTDTTNKDEGNLLFYTAAGSGVAERLRIDKDGNVLIGLTAGRVYEQPEPFGGNDITPALQIEGTGGSGGAHRVFAMTYNNNDVYASTHIFGKTRGAAVGGTTIVNSGDPLGILSFQGSDGSDLEEAAAIRAEVDGTPGDNDMPGRLVFATTADGAHAPTERLRINSSGKVGITETSPQTALHIGAGGVLRLERSDGTRYGELWNDNSFVELKASTDPIRLNGQGYIRFDIANSEKARIISGGGICFNGDTTTDNSLDDYEIGTFSVALNCHGSGSSGSINLSSSYDTLSYVKIGNLVHIQGRVYVDNVSSPQGTNVSIGTLPFVNCSSPGETSEKAFIDMQFHSMNTGSSDGGAAWIELTAGANVGIFHITRNDNSWAYISPGSFSGDSYLMFSGTYRTN